MRLHERPKASRAVLEQETALTVYLDALLQCVPGYEPEVVSAEDRQAIFRSQSRSCRIKMPMAMRNASLSPENLNPLKSRMRGRQAIFPFKTLLFRVNELILAVPLSELNGIVTAPETITVLPDGEKWLLGLMPYREAASKLSTSHTSWRLKIVTCRGVPSARVRQKYHSGGRGVLGIPLS